MRTTDGGATWSTYTGFTSSGGLNDLYFADANNGWTVGVGGIIYRTTDGGTTWTAQTSNTTNALHGVHFINATTGWAVGNLNTILKTTSGVLPVELTHFKGENQGTQNLLTWQTATEENNEGFEIQRSTNDQDWKNIGFVHGNGTTVETSNYEFTDHRTDVFGKTSILPIKTN